MIAPTNSIHNPALYWEEDYSLTCSVSQFSECDDGLPITRTDNINHHPLLQRPPIHVMLRIPNTAFGIPMALASHAILCKSIERMEQVHITAIIWMTALVLGVAISICYVYKALYYGDMVRQEWDHYSGRVHFRTTPILLTLLLALGVPSRMEETTRLELSLQLVFGICWVLQTIHTYCVYDRWIFRETSHDIQPVYLSLSTLGWFLLALLGFRADIDASWGLPVSRFCVGTGTMLYFIETTATFQSLQSNLKRERAPLPLLWLLAAPAVGVLALLDNHLTDDDNNRFNRMIASMILGWILLLFLLFARVLPQLGQDSGVLGENWVSVVPLALVTAACIRFAFTLQTTAMIALAIVFLNISTLALVAVLYQTLQHGYKCVRKQAHWGDPLLGISSSVIVPPPMHTYRSTQTQSVPLYANPV